MTASDLSSTGSSKMVRFESNSSASSDRFDENNGERRSDETNDCEFSRNASASSAGALHGSMTPCPCTFTHEDSGSTMRTVKTEASLQTTRAEVKEPFDLISPFCSPPSYAALSRFAWILIGIQFLVGVFGIVISYDTGIGATGGVISGMAGLFFVQLAWVITIPRQCSRWPFVTGLLILPFAKSCGFLVVPAAQGGALADGIDWIEFLKRFAIVSAMWSCPMYFVASMTGEVVRRDSDDGIDAQGIESGLVIREKVMVCCANYLILFPPILFYTFNAVAGLTEASEYSDLENCDTDFECETIKQFYLDMTRMAMSNIFQGLVLVFIIITLATLRSSGFDLGEMIRFRLSLAEYMTIICLLSFFIVAVYCGSALFDPTGDTPKKIAYWSIFVLPAALMMSLGKVSHDILHGKCKMKRKRDRSGLVDRRTSGLSDSIFARSSFSLRGGIDFLQNETHNNTSPESTASVDDREVDELHNRIDSLEALVKEMRNELNAKKTE